MTVVLLSATSLIHVVVSTNVTFVLTQQSAYILHSKAVHGGGVDPYLHKRKHQKTKSLLPLLIQVLLS